MIAQGPRVRMAYVSETVRGTTPVTPALKILRTISRGINFKKRVFESQEIYDDRQIRDVRHGFESVEGPLNFELSRLTYDDFLESLLGGAWTTNVLKVGTALKTFAVERQFLDVSQYQLFNGVIPNTCDLQINPEAIIGGTFNFLGMVPNALSATSIDASPDAAPTNPPFDAFNGTITEGGTTIGVVTAMTISIANGRQLTGVVGSKTSPDIFDGRLRVTGTLSAFFQDGTLFNKFATEANSSVSVTFNELGSVETMGILIPKVKYTGADMDPTPEGGVVLNMPYQGLFDTTTGTTLQITRSSNV